MNPTENKTGILIMWLLFGLAVFYVLFFAAAAMREGVGFSEWAATFSASLSDPLAHAAVTRHTLWLPPAGAAAVALFAYASFAARKRKRPGEEHGSARWGSASEIGGRYADGKHAEANILLTKHLRLGFDSRRHRRNLNVLIVGGSGAGKTRFYVKPNLMQTNCSYIVTDPKGEILRSVGHLFERAGIEITVLNLVDKRRSDGYNPLAYIKDDSDVLTLVSNLMKNTTPKGANSADPFWEKSETALLSALILYLVRESPPEDQNFATVMHMILQMGVKEEDENYMNPIDVIFDELDRETNGEHIAVKQYGVYRRAAGKTAKSVIVSAAVRLAAFNLGDVADMTRTDETDFASLGKRRRAIFAVIPDNDTSLNYLVGMMYGQAFQALYKEADAKRDGRLDVHVRAIMDEFANVALPDDFERILSTCRSREISINIIVQNMAQIKALFKDSWENLPGNCDTLLYLGGNEQSTHEYISKLLGKSTIDTQTTGLTRGRSGSSSLNRQNAGRELMTPDEVRKLDNRYALVFLRGEDPVCDPKYDITAHPNVRFTTDGEGEPYARPVKTVHAAYEDDLPLAEFSLPPEFEDTDFGTLDPERAEKIFGRILERNKAVFGVENDGSSEAAPENDDTSEAAVEKSPAISEKSIEDFKSVLAVFAFIAERHKAGFDGTPDKIAEEYALLSGDADKAWTAAFARILADGYDSELLPSVAFKQHGLTIKRQESDGENAEPIFGIFKQYDR